MALQQKVGTNLAPAIAGMPGSVIDAHYSAEGHQAASPITVGTFVFADTTDPTKVSNKGSATALVRGIATYVRNYVTAGLDASMVIAKGQTVTVAGQGKWWVKATNAQAKVGDYVFATQADGTVFTNAANAAQVGKTLTNFRVESVLGTEANSLVLISNQTPSVVQVGA